MKLIFKRHKKQWQSGICTGNGGVSSLVVGRLGTFWHCLKIFSIKNIRKTLQEQKLTNEHKRHYSGSRNRSLL
jgi:hypothetical protein